MRVRMISSLSRYGAGLGGYTGSLATALREGGDPVLVQSDAMGQTTPPNPQEAREVWSRDFRFLFQNYRAAGADPPFDVIHVQHEFTLYGPPSTAIEFPWLLAALRRFRKPVLTTMHHVIPLSELSAVATSGYVGGPLPVVRRVVRMVTRQIAHWSDSLIVHSFFARDVLINDYNVDGSRIAVIPLGVTPEASPVPADDARAAVELPPGQILLNLGHLARYKGIETLIDAFNLIAPSRPDLRLVVCGGPPVRLGSAGVAYAQDLKRRVAPELASRVLFPGFVPDSQVGFYFYAADLVILPYASPLSSSAVLSFAQGYGRPVLASRIGPLAEAVGDSRALFDAGSASQLAERITSVLDDPSLRGSLTSASQRAGEAAAWPKVAATHHELYESCLTPGTKT